MRSFPAIAVSAIGIAFTLFVGLTGSAKAQEEPPQVIDVASTKQLFVDEFLIESIRGVTLTMNPPYQDGKILLTADQPWETGPETYIGVKPVTR